MQYATGIKHDKLAKLLQSSLSYDNKMQYHVIKELYDNIMDNQGIINFNNPKIGESLTGINTHIVLPSDTSIEIYVLTLTGTENETIVVTFYKRPLNELVSVYRLNGSTELYKLDITDELIDDITTHLDSIST